MPSFAGARAKLATATQDLFRLSGNHSIPVEAPSAPPVIPTPEPPEPLSGSRKPEASIMFSLEELMKANTTVSSKREDEEAVENQLWSTQGATPLFGTAHDAALLTTPLLQPSAATDAMTLPSHPPHGRRWLPLLMAAGAGLALTGAGVWIFGPSNAASTVSATTATPVSEQAALAAQPPAPAVEEIPASPPPVSGELGAAGAGPELAEAPEAPAPAAEAAPPPAASAEAAATPAPKLEIKGKPAGKKPPPRAAPFGASKPAAVASAAFDKGAAKAALNAAAGQAASCGQGGPPAKGKIQVTFAPNGKVSDAQLVEGAFGGSAAGKCAVRSFRAAKVPAFSGAPITVAKSFKIE
jgi:hypothetical protein